LLSRAEPVVRGGLGFAGLFNGRNRLRLSVFFVEKTNHEPWRLAGRGKLIMHEQSSVVHQQERDLKFQVPDGLTSLT
jgi:hypothetical protein